jgi:hypothetical protein
MGYEISTLKNLPTHLEYYFFLIGDYRNETIINNFFNKEFSVIANRLGEKSGIIKKTQNSKIENELNNAIKKHQFKGTVVSDFFDAVSYQYPGLLILNKHPDHLTEQDKIMHIPFVTLHGVYSDNTQELLDDLVGFAHGQYQLKEKIKTWIDREKKIISGFSMGINIGIFAINFEF